MKNVDPLLGVHVLTFDWSKKAQRKVLECLKSTGQFQSIFSYSEGWTSKQMDSLRVRYKYWIEERRVFQLVDSFPYITIQDARYPMMLKEIPDPPLVLFFRGNLNLLQMPCLSVVGSRRHTDYGQRTTQWLVNDLMDYFVIVSGLAKGIDAVAHEAVLKQKGRTIAVLGTGIDVQYPSENRRLYSRIQKEGLILTEIPPYTKIEPYYFVLRNRVISGVSQGVLVTECGEKSGALKTAHFALEQNRDVFAVPGSVFSSSSQGPNNLIKNGAKCVMSCDDVFQELMPSLNNKVRDARGVEVKPEQKISESLSEQDTHIVGCLSDQPVHIDEIISKTKMPASQVLQMLTILEMKDVIVQIPGQYYTLVA